MELNWLEDFLCLARTNSFSRAAQERNITQSAFSRRIKALEHWLGAPLVDRSTYPTTLTAAGRAFLSAAEDVLRTLHLARADVRASGGVAGRARFAALHSLAVSFFPDWFKAIQDMTGTLDITLLADNMHNCVQSLTEGDVDFLLCFFHPEIPVIVDPVAFPCLPLGQDRLIPVSAADRRGRARFRLPGTAGKPSPHLAFGPDAFLGRAVEMALRRGPACHLHVSYENSMAGGLKAMALAGHGIAWLPESLVREELQDRRLAQSGRAQWDIPLEVRLYRAPERASHQAEAIWVAAQALATPAA